MPTLKNNKYRTFFFHKKEPPRTALELAVLHLLPLPGLGAANVGGEWWVQRVKADATGKIGFHVDKDESVASLKHYLVHPEYSVLCNNGNNITTTTTLPPLVCVCLVCVLSVCVCP